MELKAYKENAHGRPITRVVFSPDGNTIVSVSDDKTIKLWNQVHWAPPALRTLVEVKLHCALTRSDDQTSNASDAGMSLHLSPLLSACLDAVLLAAGSRASTTEKQKTYAEKYGEATTTVNCCRDGSKIVSCDTDQAINARRAGDPLFQQPYHPGAGS